MNDGDHAAIGAPTLLSATTDGEGTWSYWLPTRSSAGLRASDRPRIQRIMERMTERLDADLMVLSTLRDAGLCESPEMSVEQISVAAQVDARLADALLLRLRSKELVSYDLGPGSAVPHVRITVYGEAFVDGFLEAILGGVEREEIRGYCYVNRDIDGTYVTAMAESWTPLVCSQPTIVGLIRASVGGPLRRPRGSGREADYYMTWARLDVKPSDDLLSQEIARSPNATALAFVAGTASFHASVNYRVVPKSVTAAQPKGLLAAHGFGRYELPDPEPAASQAEQGTAGTVRSVLEGSGLLDDAAQDQDAARVGRTGAIDDQIQQIRHFVKQSLPSESSNYYAAMFHIGELEAILLTLTDEQSEFDPEELWNLVGPAQMAVRRVPGLKPLLVALLSDPRITTPLGAAVGAFLSKAL